MTKQQWVAQLEFLAKTSKDLTFDLLQAGADLMSSACFAYNHPSFATNPFGPEILAEIKEAQLRREIKERVRSLRRQKLLRTQKEGDQIICKMTKEGRVRALYQKIRYEDRLLPEGEYVIASFDVPEDAKTTRWWIRKRLKEFNFELHQRSVWISQRDTASDLARYFQLIGCQKWVSVFQAELLHE